MDRVHGRLFIDFFISKADNFCLYTGMTTGELERALCQRPGWLQRVDQKALRPGESHPNFTLFNLLDVYWHRPHLAWAYGVLDSSRR